MSKIVTTTLAAAALSTVALAGAAAANAYPGEGQDLRYAACVADNDVHHPLGVNFVINVGNSIRSLIRMGYTPLQARDRTYADSNTLSLNDANVMVNCATSVYFG
jgi:hypothetical protein